MTNALTYYYDGQWIPQGRMCLSYGSAMRMISIVPIVAVFE